MIPDTLTAFAAGATIATIAIGSWCAVKLIQARRYIAVLAEARDLNAAELIKERTKRLDAETRLSVAREAWARGGRNAAAAQRARACQRRAADRATVIDTANRIRAGHGMDPIEFSPADEAAPKADGSAAISRVSRGNQSGGTLPDASRAEPGSAL